MQFEGNLMSGALNHLGGGGGGGGGGGVANESPLHGYFSKISLALHPIAYVMC